MIIDLTKEEAELILDMMNYAEDPCKDTYWAMKYHDVLYETCDEDETDEIIEKLEDLSEVCFEKLRKIKKN